MDDESIQSTCQAARPLVAPALRSVDRRVACALAHPFYAVQAPLLPRHRRRLAQLFPVWETRNGSRATELNMPAAIYIETHGGIEVGGSGDHAGVDIGRTFTETPAAATAQEPLAHIRAGPARRPAASRAAPPSGPTPRWRSPRESSPARPVESQIPRPSCDPGA